MPLTSLRNLGRVALCVAALAFPTPLKGGQITVDCGQLTVGTTNALTIACNVDATAYFGCLSAGQFHWTAGNGPDGQMSVPAAVGALRKDVKSFTSSFHAVSRISTQILVAIPTNGDFVDFEKTVNWSAKLHKNVPPLTLSDQQDFTVKLTGKVRHSPGSPGSVNGPAVAITIALKEGGLAAGKERLPQPGELDPPEPEEDEYQVATDYPPYTMGEDGRVYETVPPTYEIGSQSGNWGTGSNWRTITAPPGGGWQPPGSISFTDGGGTKWVVAAGGRDFAGWTGTVYRGPDGSLTIDVNGSSYGSNYQMRFPPGYVPGKVDGVGDPVPPNVADLDPCFLAAWQDMGGGDGEDPDPPDPGEPDPPDGSKEPDPITPPPLPGGGGGGGGGGGPMPPPPPLPPPTPPPPGGGGGPSQPPVPGYTPGGPLPAETAHHEHANEMARQTAEAAGVVQQAAEGLTSWATISPGNFGSAGDWIVSLPIGGQVHTMEIPTDHAPLIRQILLLVVTGMFIVACFRLLLS